MRLLLPLLLAVPLFAVDPLDLQQVRRVYVLPMSNGMDQYLASRLIRDGLYEVVTDPKLADAVLSDRIGEPLEQKMRELYPPPPPPEVKEVKPAKGTSSGDALSLRLPDMPVRASSFSRGRGNVFLIGVASREVLWSLYQPPKETTARSLDRTAERIVRNLRKDWNRKPALEAAPVVMPTPPAPVAAPAPVKPAAPAPVPAVPPTPVPATPAPAPVKPAVPVPAPVKPAAAPVVPPAPVQPGPPVAPVK